MAIQKGDPAQDTAENGNETVKGSAGDTRSSTTLSKSEAFDVLRNSRRRNAITCLRERDEEMSVTELTTCVAAKEYDVAPEELSSEQYKRVYTGLYQCHLDRADELGVVEFDSDDNTVRLRDEAARLDPFLEDPGTPGSARVEFGIGLVVALIVSLSSLGVGPFGVIPASLLAPLTIVTLLGLALFQLY